jgi:hypothetical protein
MIREAEAKVIDAGRPWWESDSRFADRFRALDDAE